MAFQAFNASVLGIPTPVEIQGYIEEWNPDPSTYQGANLLPDAANMDEAIAWDVLEPTGGLAEAYDPDGDPEQDLPVKLKTLTEDTMYWAKKMVLGQKAILRAREPGTNKINGEKLAMDLVNKAIDQMLARKEQQIWATLLGQNIIDSNGFKKTIDYSSFLAGSPTPDVPWSTVATAKPIYNLQVWSELFDDRTDGGITLWINHKTNKYLSSNAEVRDLVKQCGEVRRIGTKNIGSLIIELAGVNIDRIVVYKGRYRDKNGTLHYFIPEGKGILIADPPKGQKLGEFRTTPSVYKGGLNPQPGMFTVIDDQLAKKAKWSVTVGQHGLPVLYFPGCIAVCNLYTP